MPWQAPLGATPPNKGWFAYFRIYGPGSNVGQDLEEGNFEEVK